MVEHSAVNRVVVGSSPTLSANHGKHGVMANTADCGSANMGSIPIAYPICGDNSMVECLAYIQVVGGSTPSPHTI